MSELRRRVEKAAQRAVPEDLNGREKAIQRLELRRKAFRLIELENDGYETSESALTAEAISQIEYTWLTTDEVRHRYEGIT